MAQEISQEPIEQTQETQQLAQAETQQEDRQEQPQEFTIPDEYKEKGWTQKVKSVDDLWKQLDNTQSLLGKKTVIPDFEKAGQSEIEEYFNQLRPSSKDAYQFDESIDADRKEMFANLLYENGISKYQAEKLMKGYTELENKILEDMYSKDKFIDSVKSAYGDKFDSKIKELETGILDSVSKEDKQIIDNLPNDAKLAVYKLVDKLGVQGNNNNPPSESGRISPETIKQDLEGVDKELANLNKRPHTQAERSALVQRRIELQNKLRGN